MEVAVLSFPSLKKIRSVWIKSNMKEGGVEYGQNSGAVLCESGGGRPGLPVPNKSWVCMDLKQLERGRS